MTAACQSSCTVSVPVVVMIDYDQDFKQLIAKFSGFKDNITEKNFPIIGTGQVTIEVVQVCFDPSIESDDVVAKEMEQMGLRHATLWELVVYGLHHWQGDPDHIYAFGSQWIDPHHHTCSPYLSYFNCRALCLSNVARPGRGRFLAVRK